MYKLLRIDLQDAYIYADAFKESNDLEELLGLAIATFHKMNPSFKNYSEWQEKAEDGAYELEIVGEGHKSLFRGSMMLLSPQVEIALKMALKHHEGQIRKGDGKQYIIHLLEISKLLFDRGVNSADQELIAASLCHDLLEDTDCPESEIEKWCGPEVLRIVKAVSNDPELESKEDWEAKKIKYIESVKAGESKAMIVCLADKIVNLRALLKIYKQDGEAIWGRFNRGKEKKLWFEKKVLKMLKKSLDHPLIEIYEELIRELETAGKTKN